MFIPRSGEDFLGRPLNVLLLDYTLLTVVKPLGHPEVLLTVLLGSHVRSPRAQAEQAESRHMP